MENMNGSGGMFLYNLLWSIFLRPYTVKYFLYQYLPYCLDLLSVKFFTGSAEKTVNAFLLRFYNFWNTLVPNFINF